MQKLNGQIIHVSKTQAFKMARENTGLSTYFILAILLHLQLQILAIFPHWDMQSKRLIQLSYRTFQVVVHIRTNRWSMEVHSESLFIHTIPEFSYKKCIKPNWWNYNETWKSEATKWLESWGQTVSIHCLAQFATDQPCKVT